jgi:hypothetical protein
MSINIIADKAEELPEPIRNAAVEQNGKFVVQQLPDGWGVDHVASYKTKLTKAEQDLKRRDERLRAFAIDDAGNIPEPDQFKALLAEHRQLKEAQGKQPNVEELFRKAKAEAEAPYAKKLSDLEKALAEHDRALDNSVLDAEINALLAALRPKDGKADLVKLMLRDRLTLEKEGTSRKVRVRAKDGSTSPYELGNGPDGFMPAKDYVMGTLRATLADILEAEQSGGAGATGSGNRRIGSNVITFKRSDLQTKANQLIELQKRAKAEGKVVEIIDA